MPHLPKIVRQRLRGPTSVSDLHPDADLLTAFAEKSLQDSERARVTDHLARCGDCREIVALALPVLEDTTTAGVRPATVSRTGWFLRWGVVAAGITLAASVGVVQLRQRRSTDVAHSALQRQEVAATTPAPADHLESDGVENGRRKKDRLPSPHAEKARRAASKTDVDQAEFAPNAASRVPPQPDPGDKANPSRPYAGTAGGVLGGSTGRGRKFATATPPRDLNFAQSLKNFAAAPEAPEKQLSAPSSPPAATSVQVAPASPAIQAEPATVNDQAQSELSLDKAQVAKAKPPVSNADLSAAPAAAVSTEASAPVPPQSQVVEVSSVPASRWTITSSGTLQRSSDGGKTWTDVNLSPQSSPGSNYVLMRHAPPPTETAGARKAGSNHPEEKFTGRIVFRAVSAAGAEVWAGGVRGVLYHSSDGGESWTRVVPAAAGVTLTGDIITIEFTDEQNGKLTTSPPETWTTADAGQSWQKQ